jgi:predicted permease
MSPLAQKFVITAAAVVLTTAAGYLGRRLGWVKERVGEAIMTFVGAFGYATVGFLSVWGTPLHASDAVLPLMAVAHVVIMTGISLALAGFVTHDRGERGLFAVAGGVGNNGFTMGAFVLYLLYGETGMGLGNLYCLLFAPTAVLFIFPVARHFASKQRQGSLASLLVRNLFDWRSIGLPLVVVAIVLSALGVPRPPQIATWHVMDALVFTITPLAFFGIGLRLHIAHVLTLWRMLVGLAIVRFGIAAAVGVALSWLTWLTPWPLHGLRWNVNVVESFVPTAVTMVAVANMFSLRPREASALFVVNTVMYLVLVLPVVFWIFG